MSMEPSAGDHPGPEDVADVQMEQEFRRSLYRFDCPGAHTLGEYQLDLLDPVQRTSIAAHATECEDCQAELTTLRAYLAAPTPLQESVSVVERVRRVVASLFTPAPGLAYGGLRGGAEASTQVFDTGEVTVTVGPGQVPGALIGLVVQSDAPPEALLGREARLVSPGAAPISALLDDLGNFEFANVAPGLYSLELDLTDSLVVAEALRVD
jgi:hypothetical protein